MRARLKDEEKALRQAEGDVVDAIAEQIASGRRGVPSAEAYLSGSEPKVARRATSVRLPFPRPFFWKSESLTALQNQQFEVTNTHKIT